MNKWLLTAGLVLATTWLGGCIVIDTENDGSWRSNVVEPADVTIREIDAAGQLSLEDNRREAYVRIARRHNLSADAQVHLIEAVFKYLSLEDAKMNALLTLVHNRCFRSEAKGALLDRLGGLALEDNRREILNAMSKK